MIIITDAASERIRELLERDGKLDTHCLRMKVVGGGCSGLQYELAFEEVGEGSDTIIEAGAVRVVVDDKSALYLAGSSLDFIDTLQESGFKIGNPNASNTCGCGQSFAA